MAATVTRRNSKGRAVASDPATLSHHAVEPIAQADWHGLGVKTDRKHPAMAFELYVRKGKRSHEVIRVFLDGDDVRALWAGFDKLGRMMAEANHVDPRGYDAGAPELVAGIADVPPLPGVGRS